MAKVPARVKTGLAELDTMLDGGLLEGAAILVQGAPGVGKTTLGLQYLVSGATAYNAPGLFITFEEFPASIYRDAAQLGWDLRDLEKRNLLRLVFTSPEVLLTSLQEGNNAITDLIQSGNVRRIVLDSVTLYRRLSDDPQRLREIYTTLINALKREGVTSLLMAEDRVQAPTLQEQGKLAFIVDGIILMRYVEVNSSMQRALTVLKMRGVCHERSIRRFEIGPGGLRLRELFGGLEGILTGSSHQAGR